MIMMLKFDFQENGAMVAVLHVGEDVSTHQLFFQWGGYGNIIDTPSFVIEPYTRETLTPPAIAMWFGMKDPEGIDPATF
jgi:hypothetical protein